MNRALGFVLLSVATLIPPSVGKASSLVDDDSTMAARAVGRIVLYFSGSNHKEPAGLYVVDPLNHEMTRVAEVPIKNGPIALADLQLSPDGRRIAYGEMKSVNHTAVFTSIWIWDLQPGSQPRKISDIGGRPIWSPDGKQLLVTEYLGEGGPEGRLRFAAWRINDDGSHPARLPIPDDFQIEDWSGDGLWLTGIRPAPRGSRDFEIVVMRTDGTSRRNLTGPGQRFQPHFSPDGRSVVFVESSKDPAKGMKGQSLEVVDLDGKNIRRVYLEPDDAHIGGIAWSPDGRSLVTNLDAWGPDEQGNVTLINPRLCIIDVAEGKIRFLQHPKATVLGRPQWR